MRRVAAFLAVAVFCVLSVGAASWRLYPAFDRTPARILDTEGETFFLVHQQLYDKNISTGYEFPTLALFHYSKDNPDAGIQPFSSKVKLSSADIRLADYNPVAESLFVAYGNGGIDIVTKERSVINVDVLTKTKYPGMGLINSVSFDPVSGDAWVATDAGYLQLDGKTGDVKKVVPLGLKLQRVFGVGENLVAVSANRLYMGSIDARKTEDLKILENLENVAVIFPINGESFYYLSGIMGGNNGIFVATVENDGLKTSKVGEDRFTAVPTQSAVANRFESNGIPIRGGYLLFSPTKAWYLPTNSDGAARSLALDETAPSVLGSWDMTDFWTYRYRGKFVNCHASYNPSKGVMAYTPTWKDNGGEIRPNAPASFLCPEIIYSPKYGLLAQQHGCDRIYTYYSRINPLLLSELRGGNWKVLSQAYDIPYAVEKDEALKTRYNSEYNWFPMADLSGIAIDPLNPDYLWCGSLWSGVGRFDISDIRRTTVRFAGPLDKFADIPGFHVLTEDQKWDTMSCFSPVSFDSDATLWTLFFDYNGMKNKESSLSLYFLTAGERGKISESESTADVEWGKIVLPVPESLNIANRLIALKHPTNRNKLVIFPSTYDGYLIIYDHKGTLLDTSDDEIVKIGYFTRPNGIKFQLSNFHHMIENPMTGEIFVATDSRAFSFNPNDKVENGAVNVRLLGLKDGTGSDVYPESTYVTRLLFDSEGRLWIATSNQGVIGINKDFTEVVARYDTANSPIPSNMAYGLGWDPEERILLISTDKGMAAVQPDAAGVAYVGGVPSVYPQAIAPDYNGVLWMRNLSPNMTITITDSDGKIVRNLRAGTNEEIAWDLKDDNGKRLRPGTYEIRFSDGSVIYLPILTAE